MVRQRKPTRLLPWVPGGRVESIVHGLGWVGARPGSTLSEAIMQPQLPVATAVLKSVESVERVGPEDGLGRALYAAPASTSSRHTHHAHASHATHGSLREHARPRVEFGVAG